MSLIPFVVVWVLVALTVVALLVWRKTVTRNEDDNLHVLDGGATQQSAAQVELLHKLEFIDKWGKLLTIVTVVYGLILAGLYVYQAWVTNTRLGV